MKKTRVVFWPVPHGLRREGGSRITLDRDGRESCDRALLVAETEYPDGGYVILPTAGKSPDFQWNNVVVSGLMRDYMIGEGGVETLIETREASAFNTLGEAREIVRYIEQHEDVQEVIICGKYWHALRCWILLDFCLSHSRKITGHGRWQNFINMLAWLRLARKSDAVGREQFERPVRIRVEACPSADASDTSIRNEFNFAIPKNKLRLALAKIQYWIGIWD